MSCNCCFTDKHKDPVCDLTNLSDPVQTGFETFSFELATGGFLDGTYIMDDNDIVSMMTGNSLCTKTYVGVFGLIFSCGPRRLDGPIILPDLGDNTDCSTINCNSGGGCGLSMLPANGCSFADYTITLSKGTSEPCCDGIGLSISASIFSVRTPSIHALATLTMSYYAPKPPYTIIRDNITLYGEQPRITSLNSTLDTFAALPSMSYFLNDYNNLPDTIVLTKV